MRMSDWSSDVCSSDLPAKRPLALAEQRADIRGHEARKIEGIFDAVVVGDLANIVAVIDHRHTHGLEIQHCAHVRRARGRGIAMQAVKTGCASCRARVCQYV